LEEIINLPKNFLSKGDNIEYFPTLKRVQNRDATIPIDSKVINFPSRNN